MNESEKPATKVVEVVYMGRRAAAKGKIAYEAKRYDEQGESRFYSKRPFGIPSYASPGQIFEVEVEEANPDTFYPAQTRFARLFPDAEYRALWEAKDRAAQATIDSAKEARAAEDGIAELCKPLRNVYRRASVFERAALLIRIIAEIQS